MEMSTLDHHTGKPVKNIVAGDEVSTIIFEDGATIDVPGQISQDFIGQILLTVEGDNPPTLVFGYTQGEEPAVRTAEIPVPIEPVLAEIADFQPDEETVARAKEDMPEKVAEEKSKRAVRGRQKPPASQ
jgi:hypothetical protein